MDEELLKVRIAKAAALDGALDQTLLTTLEWQWVRAALGDRERLRAAAEAAVDWWFYSDESGQVDRDTYGFDKPMIALRAVLEGRDG